MKKLFIVSGLSGSGKSSALHTLEDLGFYCIDNLPAPLLQAFAAQVSSTAQRGDDYAAVGIDAVDGTGRSRCRSSGIVGFFR